MAGLCAPLSTLRRCPREHLRMTRGRCGSLLLHRDGLAPSTPCRSPGALRSTPESELKSDIRPCPKSARSRRHALTLHVSSYHSIHRPISTFYSVVSYIRKASSAFRNNSVTEFLYRWFEDGRVADRSKKKGKENR